MGNDQRKTRERSDYDVDWQEDPANTLDLQRSRTPKWLVIVPLLLLVLTGVFLWDAARSDDTVDTGADDEPSLQSEVDGEAGDDAEAGGDDAAAGDDQAEDAAATDAGDGDASDSSGSTAGSTGAAELPEPPTDAPYVDATLVNEAFTLSGVVPSQELKAALDTQGEVAYAPFFTSELLVDESVGDAAWLPAAPQLVGLLPMIVDGTIRIQDDQAYLAGRSGKPEHAEAFVGTVGLVSGLPVENAGIEVLNQQSPFFRATAEDGTLALEGELPSEQIVQLLLQGAASVYGEENVTSELTVDPDRHQSFWMFTMPANFVVLQPFSAYQLQVEEGVFSGRLEGGIAFETDSAELRPEGLELLQIGVAIMARDPLLGMTVVGHTDSSGPDEYNDALSLRRAESTIAFFEQAGIPPERLQAEGRGEDEPIAPNDTAEGRALNRRVEFLFQGAPVTAS